MLLFRINFLSGSRSESVIIYTFFSRKLFFIRCGPRSRISNYNVIGQQPLATVPCVFHIVVYKLIVGLICLIAVHYFKCYNENILIFL